MVSKKKPTSYKRRTDLFPPPQQLLSSATFDEWVDSFEITDDDLRNQFNVTIKFNDIKQVSASASTYGVIGSKTVVELCKTVSYRLWEEHKVISPYTEVDLFRQDGEPIPGSTTLAEVLKEANRLGFCDGVFLLLKCSVRGFWGLEYSYFLEPDADVDIIGN